MTGNRFRDNPMTCRAHVIVPRQIGIIVRAKDRPECVERIQRHQPEALSVFHQTTRIHALRQVVLYLRARWNEQDHRVKAVFV